MKTNPLRFGLLILMALCSGAVADEARADSAADASSQMEALVNERLQYMKAVAAYKWLHQIPIEDLERESEVLEAARRSGLRYGLTTTSSQAFFATQILAAKDIQRHWFRIWQEAGGPLNAPDLNTELRPRLLTLGDQIIRALAHHAKTPGETQLEFRAEGLPLARAEQLKAAINDLKVYDTQLDQITQSKLLRVGTTYDYAPFSYRDRERPVGIDVELAADLAESLGAELVLIETSWPTLMADLAAGKFDIGMSGISINLERQKTALFSNAYHSGGKTPISRCTDVKTFDTFEKIDQPETRLIVNPGGTNQKFVDANIKQANVRVHDDNRTIFTEIVDGRADVMMTDAIEVRLQSNLISELCPTMPGDTLTVQQKGFLLPRDLIWQQYVNSWLQQRRLEGKVDALFTRYLAPST